DRQEQVRLRSGDLTRDTGLIRCPLTPIADDGELERGGTPGRQGRSEGRGQAGEICSALVHAVAIRTARDQSAESGLVLTVSSGGQSGERGHLRRGRGIRRIRAVTGSEVPSHGRRGRTA